MIARGTEGFEFRIERPVQVTEMRDVEAFKHYENLSLSNTVNLQINPDLSSFLLSGDGDKGRDLIFSLRSLSIPLIPIQRDSTELGFLHSNFWALGIVSPFSAFQTREISNIFKGEFRLNLWAVADLNCPMYSLALFLLFNYNSNNQYRVFRFELTN